MIQLLSKWHQQKIAFLLFCVFYSNFMLGAYARMPIRKKGFGISYYFSSKNNISEEGSFAGQTTQYDAGNPEGQGGYQGGGGVDSIQAVADSAANKTDDDDFTSGPSQPETQSFQSVNNANMVDLFTGDFSYNIPLMDVGGYPLNISYRGGISMDQEASWVGLGWSINPGTITRNMRGLPDDFNGAADTIRKTASVRDNKTVGVRLGADIETVGFPIGLGLTGEIFHNSYKGWGLESGINVSINAGQGAKGPLSGGISITNNSQQGVSITPSLSVNLGNKNAEQEGGLTGNLSMSSSYNSRSGIKSLDFSAGVRQYASQSKDLRNASIGTGLSPSISFATLAYTPTITMPFTSTQYSFTVKVGFEAWGLHPNGSIGGYVSSQKVEYSDTSIALPAFGYLNYQNGANNPSALLDFNREKEIPYRENPPVPNIAIPNYTFDIFSITGEGTGGMFRAYRGDIGNIYDHFIKTKDGTDRFSLDIGIAPDLVHVGADIYLNSAYTQNNGWTDDNPLKNTIAFRNADSTFENVYFKNPGEKSINSKAFYDAVGGDDVVSVGLYQPGNNNPFTSTTNYLNHYINKKFTGTSTLSPANVVKTTRDKRSQVISYLNATEACLAGLSRHIENYAYNTYVVDTCSGNSSAVTLENRITGYRKANHISEIDVLNADGRRYVYGIPVYNLKQKDATFSVDPTRGIDSEGIVKYNPGSDNTAINNKLGNDYYFTSEEIPAYAHSFLLTGVLSPDYVDLTGDGISDDDLGDAVKFNYTKVAGSTNPYKWRTPYTNYGEATYNRGLLTDSRDDKGSYVYGEKELWYLNSVQSKTMIATFKLEDRKDLLPIDEAGNKDTTNNGHNGSKLLREIDLYSKADYLKNGANAIPIKTVHFVYSYELCTGINRNVNSAGTLVSYPYKDSGKLTLKEIYFTYNGNVKTVALNPYIFHYSSNNPAYNSKSYDRWGNYKCAQQNPNSKAWSTVTNSEYPYALQDSATAATNAAAWTLDSIVLPSAGRIKVTYESDDYAYVQNKRAMQMFNVKGFASSPGGASTYKMYDDNGDNLFVNVYSPDNLASKNDVYFKYLDGVEKLYFKLYVKMPSDQWGSGSEYVPVYADIDTAYSNGGYGLIDAHNFWIKMKGISLAGDQDGNYSPLAKAALQFLRLNLSSKAYPSSEVGDNLDFGVLMRMVISMAINQMDAFNSFDAIARGYFWANTADTNRTLIRLDNPDFKRLGGGLRVKQITIYDHWNTMSGQKESKYGQTYDYTTIKEVNGVQTRISSGVASYEPMIGGEENPFHVPVRYVERVAPLAPVTLGYVEEPLGESFFPSADVGYSKVRVRSINTVNRKSANGYEETGFYTAYDFPTLVDNTMIDDNSKKRYTPGLANFLHIDAKNYLTISQGFKIELNDMHGRMKYQATYPETDSVNPISYTKNFYKVDDQNAEFKHLANTATVIDALGNVDTAAVIGKDVEIMTDMREQTSVTAGVNVELNVDLFLIGFFPVPLPSFIPFPEHEVDRYRSVATTKVIKRYGILDSVIHIEKGSLVSTSNLAYDSETGDVLLTKTNNEFNDPLYNFTYPAHWAYSGMGLAYKNIDAVFKGITINNGVPLASTTYPNFINYFESGDEIIVAGRDKTGDSTQANCDGIAEGCSVNIFSSTFDTTIIWAVNAQKISTSNPESIVFIDKNGNAYNATDVMMKIIRSGKRNMSMTPVGSLTSLKSPLQVISGSLKLVLDSTDNIIATGAAVFNDFWRVADKKSSYTIDNSCTCGPLKVLFDYLIASHRLFIHESDGITVGSLVADAQAAGYVINISDCGILSTNANKLFYATTTDSISGTYSANIGLGSITISASPSETIHFYSLHSTSCLGDNKVHYQDNANVLWQYDVKNFSGSHQNFGVDNCTGTAEIGLDSGATSDCFWAKPGKVHIGDYSVTGLDTVGGCPTATELCVDTTSITLSIQACTSCPTYACYSAITDTTVNPYATGIYGNWRTTKSYVYYGTRAETDPSASTNIRKNGVINSFVPYWSFTGTYLQPSVDSTRWVWNAQTTMFNKKGFELENTDPLGRYNSGRYGYNNTLPVSVTQNSQYREQFFDGFEDYSYKNQNCSSLCPVPRDMDFSQTHGTLDTVNKHTGKYSLKINAGDSANLTIPVTALLKDTASQKIRADFDIKVITDTIVTGKGHGLDASNLAYNGYVQVPVSGNYTFAVLAIWNFTPGASCSSGDTCDYISFSWDGVTKTRSIAHHAGTSQTLTFTVFVTAGSLHQLQILSQSGPYIVSFDRTTLTWKRTCETGESIPDANIYRVSGFSTTDSAGSFAVNTAYDCNKLKGIHTDSSSLIPAFSPLQGGKMWLSGWVQEQQTCLCQNYTNNQIKLSFFDSTGHLDTTVIAKPSGTIIEGWQRYDYVFTVPLNAASIQYVLMATGSTAVNFDDLRLHPFNANMKSFVYNPVNLRLMAELDENNYATFYEYDDDGTLIRVKKETQRGIQTIKETRSYLTKYSNQ